MGILGAYTKKGLFHLANRKLKGSYHITNKKLKGSCHLANRAVKERESDPWSDPSAGYHSTQTLCMEDVTTVQLNTRATP